MALTLKRLTEITQIAAAAGSVFANPSSTKSYVRLIVIHNTNTTAETVELWNVPDNAGAVGTAADANKMHKLSVPANETINFEFSGPGLVLEDENDTIQAKADTVSKVTIQLHGAQET